MKIKAYKCRFTGTIYQLDQKAEYVQHLKELRADMKAARKMARFKRAFNQWLTAEKEKIVHIDMIAPWILENQKKLMKAQNILYPHRGHHSKWYPATDEITDLNLNVRYNAHVSNSHSCPQSGVTNWCARDKTKPTSYPGFEGRIRGVTKRSTNHMSAYPTSDLLAMVGIKTGTGGGGNEGWAWDTDVFLDDWPGLSQQIMVEILKGERK